MITKNIIRLHFLLIMLAVFIFSIILSKIFQAVGVDTYLQRTLLVFLFSYGWFFLMVKLWLSYIQSAQILKTVASYSGKEKSRFEWSDLGSFDIPLGDNIFSIIIAALVITFFIAMMGYALSIEAPLLLIDAAFEVSIAGGLLRTIGRAENGSWFKVVFRRTIVFFLISLVCGSLLAWSFDRKTNVSSQPTHSQSQRLNQN